MTQQVTDQSAPTSAIRASFFILILAGFVLAWGSNAYEEYLMLHRVHEGAPLLKVRELVPPMILFLPAFITLGWGIYRQATQTMPPEGQKKGLIFIIGSFPAFILTWLVYSSQLFGWLEDEGYSQCHWYSGATLGAAKVMVRDSGYCIEEGYQVRIGLIDWFEEQYEQGHQVSLSQFQQKQVELLTEFQARYQ